MRPCLFPVGESDFVQMRQNGAYYVDKTLCLQNLNGGASFFVTAPPHFGKTVMMRMLESFFDIRTDSRALFADLAIAQDAELCRRKQNQYPTLFLSFASVDGQNFEDACSALATVFSALLQEHSYLLENDQLSEMQQKELRHIAERDISWHYASQSLAILIDAMQTHYGKHVVVLLDAYDTPLEKAREHGYLPQMTDWVRGLLHTLEENWSAELVVIAGRMRYPQAGPFGRLDRFLFETLATLPLGFTQAEVDQLLANVGAASCAETWKNWYGGYSFGKKELFCPRDVMAYLHALQADPNVTPVNFWENSREHALLRTFAQAGGSNFTGTMEHLSSGHACLQSIQERQSYDYQFSNESELWSVLYLNGCLTKSVVWGISEIRLPNEQMRALFRAVLEEFPDL